MTSSLQYQQTGPNILQLRNDANITTLDKLRPVFLSQLVSLRSQYEYILRCGHGRDRQWHTGTRVMQRLAADFGKAFLAAQKFWLKDRQSRKERAAMRDTFVHTSQTQHLAALLSSADNGKTGIPTEIPTNQTTTKEASQKRPKPHIREEHIKGLQHHANAIDAAFLELYQKGWIPTILDSYSNAQYFGTNKLKEECKALANAYYDAQSQIAPATVDTDHTPAQGGSAPAPASSAPMHPAGTPGTTSRRPTTEERHAKLDAGFKNVIIGRERRALERAGLGISTVTETLSSLQMSQRRPPPARTGTTHSGSLTGSSFTPMVNYSTPAGSRRVGSRSPPRYDPTKQYPVFNTSGR